MAQRASNTRRISSRRPRMSPRNTVPPFVQKTYNIVNDSKNHDVIRWSDSGESFLILDQQRLRDILGRWFKHDNPNSFVRQLNNYGFYKLQDLQQGSLRNGSDTQYSCFAHTGGYFRRGDPDTLKHIRQTNRTRNRNAAPTQSQDGDDDDDETFMDLIGVDEPCSGSPSITPGQTPTLATILQDIAHIKREQAGQVAELDKLRNAYQVLFQDCHAKLQQHQETIGHILGLLARIYHSRNNTGETGESQSSADALVLHATAHPTLQGSQGFHLSDESSGTFEIVEVEAGGGPEDKNKISKYSIETPTEDAASPASTSDDGSLGTAAATHDPRIINDIFYDSHPSQPTTFSNHNMNLDLSPHYPTSSSTNLSHLQYGGEQPVVMAPALDFSPQTLSPRTTMYNFETQGQAKAEDKPTGLPSTTSSPPLAASFVITPSTPPRATSTSYPTSSSSPFANFEDTSSLSPDTLPSSPDDTSFFGDSSFASSDFSLNSSFSYLTSMDTSYGPQGDWMNAMIGIDSLNDAASGRAINISSAAGTNNGGTDTARYTSDLALATSFHSANAAVLQGVASPSFMRGSQVSSISPGVDANIATSSEGRKRKPEGVMMVDLEETGAGAGIGMTEESAGSKKRRVSF